MFAAAAKRTALAAATLSALGAVSLVGAAGGAPGGKVDKNPPTTPTNLGVVAATESTVSVTWDVSQDDVGVAGYYVYGDGGRARALRNAYTVVGAECGQSIYVAVQAFDSSGNRSERVPATVSTAPCADLQAPSSPSGFRQAATTQDSVVLAWDPSQDNVGVVRYGVYRSQLSVATPSEPTVTLTGLSCGSAIEHRIDAVDAAGNHSARVSVWVQTAGCADGQPPSAPTSLAVTSRTETSVALSWVASSDDVGVAGYRISVNTVPFATVTQASGAVTGLMCGTTYTIGVDAYDAAGNRSQAASLSAATQQCSQPPPPPTGDTTPPSQPGGLAVSAASTTSVSLTWTPSTDNIGVTGYDLFVNGASAQAVSQPGATVASLACGTAYLFEVAARDAAGNRSTRASATTSTAPCADTQPPTAPTGVSATSRTATSIALAWVSSTDNVGVAGYGLYRGGVQQGTSTTTTGIFSGLTCNTNYTLAVDAYDVAGNRSPKVTLMVATTACPDTTPPSTPTGLSASNVSQTSLTLTWSASSDNVGVTGYDVYRDGAKVTATSSATSAQSGLTCGTSYSFGVVARDAAGNSSGQASTTSSTAACSSPPPTGWTFCANEGQQCTFSGTKEVRYGANTTYTTPRTFTAPVMCTNSVFGDPLNGVVKHCEYRDVSPGGSTPPPPSSGGTALDDFSDFQNNVFTQTFQNRWKAPPAPVWTTLGFVGEPWADGSGVFEASTPHGPGFRIVQNESVPRGSGALVGMADIDHFVDQQAYLGTVTELSGKLMFPSSGNPSGFPAYGDWNVLWEFTQSTVVHNLFGVDALAPGGPTIYVRAFDPADPANRNGRKSRAPSPLQYDRWYDWRWQIKWSEGSDGYVNFWLDGQQIAAFVGPSVLVSGGAPYLEWGWYGGYNAGRNEVRYAALARA